MNTAEKFIPEKAATSKRFVMLTIMLLLNNAKITQGTNTEIFAKIIKMRLPPLE